MLFSFTNILWQIYILKLGITRKGSVGMHKDSKGRHGSSSRASLFPVCLFQEQRLGKSNKSFITASFWLAAYITTTSKYFSLDGENPHVY